MDDVFVYNHSYSEITTKGAPSNQGCNPTDLPQAQRMTENQPNTALLSFVLMFSTFFLADYFRRLKTSKFLSRESRALMGDFAMPIAIVTMVSIDYFVPNVYTQVRETSNSRND